LNMLESRMDADRMENDIYMFIDVGILIRKKQMEDGKVRRYIDQVCFFYREDVKNTIFTVVLSGKLVGKNLPGPVLQKFERMEIHPFSSKGGK
jgi:pilus assembly protein CpaF